ncbi:hypothetical protein PInf_002704 [Phytophthora infestans]|nr:hypothetical protein PInf_002704 [Phytophthora infestans]
MSKRLIAAEHRRFKDFIDAALDYDEYGTPGDDRQDYQAVENSQRAPPVKTPKKPRGSDKSAKSTPPLVPSAEYKALVDLNPDAPESVKHAVYFILAKAEAVGKKPWCIAYPWTGRPQWYNPLCFRAIYRANWRVWMSHRRTFWEWALYVPLASETVQNNRRKAKTRAVQARVAFIRLCIETWGFMHFSLSLPSVRLCSGWEVSPVEITKKVYTTTDTLASLEDNNPERYQATIDNALEPVQIDAYGHPSIRVLLETTEALVPTAKPANRLSIVALARVRLDLQSQATPRHTWVGSKRDEPWKAIINNALVKQTQLTVAVELENEEDEDETKAAVPTATVATSSTADSQSAEDDAIDGKDDDKEFDNDDDDDDDKDEYKPEDDEEEDDDEKKAEDDDEETSRRPFPKRFRTTKGRPPRSSLLALRRRS